MDTTNDLTIDSTMGSAAGSETHGAARSKGKHLAGRIISGVVVLFLVFDFTVKLLQLTVAAEATAKLGFPVHLLFSLGVVLAVCTVLYAIPRTSWLGAILLTGYLGGATAIHLRIGQPFFFPIVVGVLAWLGLYLRDERLRALVRGRSIA
jgi:hypothetical protein